MIIILLTKETKQKFTIKTQKRSPLNEEVEIKKYTKNLEKTS